jgi:hypothetical protein
MSEETSETFKAMREARRERRARVAVANEREMREHGEEIGFEAVPAFNSWRVWLKGHPSKSVMFYTASGKVIHKNRFIGRGVRALIAYLRAATLREASNQASSP